jgi:hypothetical protein
MRRPLVYTVEVDGATVWTESGEFADEAAILSAALEEAHQHAARGASAFVNRHDLSGSRPPNEVALKYHAQPPKR